MRESGFGVLVSGLWQIPKLLFREGMHLLPTTLSGSVDGARNKWTNHRLSIFEADNVHHSLFATSAKGGGGAHTFSYSRLLDLSPIQVQLASQLPLLERSPL